MCEVRAVGQGSEALRGFWASKLCAASAWAAAAEGPVIGRLSGGCDDITSDVLLCLQPAIWVDAGQRHLPVQLAEQLLWAPGEEIVLFLPFGSRRGFLRVV